MPPSTSPSEPIDSLSRRVALVTGAGSPLGIGFAAARLLGRGGARIAIASTTDRIHDRVAELASMGITATGHVGDLMADGAPGRLVAEVLEAHGGRTHEGVAVRVAQRILAMAAAIWHNNKTCAPVTRSLIAYDH